VPIDLSGLKAPTFESWSELCRQLDGVAGESLARELDAAETALHGWPDRLRRAGSWESWPPQPAPFAPAVADRWIHPLERAGENPRTRIVRFVDATYYWRGNGEDWQGRESRLARTLAGRLDPSWRMSDAVTTGEVSQGYQRGERVSLLGDDRHGIQVREIEIEHAIDWSFVTEAKVLGLAGASLEVTRTTRSGRCEWYFHVAGPRDAAIAVALACRRVAHAARQVGDEDLATFERIMLIETAPVPEQ
jgi:hypothetical protein